MDVFFSQYFGIDASVVEDYGAIDISVASDIPLFIDPFLLFTSDRPEYQQLHEGILRYLRFLRDKSQEGPLPAGIVKNLFRFKEVKQNWLGFTVMGNEGRALGPQFAAALNENLAHVFKSFGAEEITSGSHLEKVALISGHVGRDGISDFTTCLIKEFLAEYTQKFALEHLSPDQRELVAVPRVRFNYVTESWETGRYVLPIVRDDWVLLTPADMLTRDETWISANDLHARFRQIPASLDDDAMRDQVNAYFEKQLGEEPDRDQFRKAVVATIREYPELIDYYIKLKEDSGDEAVSVSSQKVRETEDVLIRQLKVVLEDLKTKSDFYQKPYSSIDEARERVLAFKHYVEHQDGYRLINHADKAPSRETDVQLFFGLIWHASRFDVNREPNNGRGPVDFKVSLGSADKSLIEFKLASNTKLKQNLQKQVEIYEKANQTQNSLKVIICYTANDIAKVQAVLSELKLESSANVIVIDARNDNKPSASKA